MMLLGVAVLFFTHNLITNFMINIVRNVGGDSSDMGSINGVMALLEIPVMLAVMMIMTLPALKRGKLSRAQGIILLCIYAAFCAIQFTM